MMATKAERSAAFEIIAKSYKLVLNRIFFLPLSWRRWLFKSYIEGLSKMAFDEYGMTAVLALSFSKAGSSKYKNTEKELEAIISEIPRLGRYQGILREHLSTHRKKCKLKN